MILASQQHIKAHLTKFANIIVAERKIPVDWNLFHIINCCKEKVTASYGKLLRTEIVEPHHEEH